MQTVIVALSTFVLGIAIGLLSSEDPHASAEHKILEQTNAQLERENEELQEANEEWYDKCEKEAAQKRQADEKLRGLYLCVGVLGSIIAVNSVSSYIIMMSK
jgi:hypothetical protein